MSRNGSGTYSLPAGNPVVTGTVISSTWANNTLSDIATAITGSLAADGQTSPSANLPMATYRHTNVGAAVATTDYARADQVQNGSMQYLSSVAGTDTITATATPTPAAYAAGQTFRFVSAGANTGAVTLNVSSLGAKSITKLGSTALSAGDIPSGSAVEVIYDGTRFQLVNIAPAAGISLAGNNSWTGQQTFKNVVETPYTITDGAAFEIDPANGSIQTITLTASRTPAATNFAAGQSVLLGIDDGSAYTITWSTVNPTWVKPGGTGAAPTLATSGYTWVLLWKVGSTIYAAEVGKP